MQLRLFEQYKAAFVQKMRSARFYAEDYKWENLSNFQAHWDVLTDDFGGMYDRSLNSTISRKLWNSEQYFPKKMMLKFIEMQPEFMCLAFKDLLNEDAEVSGRMSRFVYYCDEMLANWREKHPRQIETSHFHEDYRMVSLYLATM